MLHPALTLLILPASPPQLAAHAPLVGTVQVQSDGPSSSAAPGTDEVEKAVADAVDFLLGSQEDYQRDRPVGRLPDDELAGWQEQERARLDKLRGADDAREWPYEGVYRVRGGVIPTGYRVGGTSIVCEALLRVCKEGPRRKEVEASVLRSLEFVLDRLGNDRSFGRGPKTGYDVRGWGHLHALQLLLMLKDEEFVKKKVRDGLDDAIEELIVRLQMNTTKQGGWNYANDSSVSPFMTGSTLLVLFQAVEAGFKVDQAVIEKALDALQDGRTDVGSYAYSGGATRPVAMPGSSARAAVAELALLKAGRSDLDALRVAVDGFFTGWDDLLARKSKQGTHERPYGIAPYYFFFGHTFAAHAIEELPEKERDARRAELLELLWRTRDGDGTWNDRIFPRTASFSTAMVLLAINSGDQGGFPEWEPSGKK